MAYLAHDIGSGDDAGHRARPVAYDDHVPGIVGKERCGFRKLTVVADQKQATANFRQQVVDPYHVITIELISKQAPQPAGLYCVRRSQSVDIRQRTTICDTTSDRDQAVIRHGRLSAYAMQLARQGGLPKVDHRAPRNVSRSIDVQARPAAAVEEAQSIFALVLVDPALAEGCDLLSPQQGLHGRRIEAQQVGKQPRVDEDTVRAELDLHRIRP